MIVSPGSAVTLALLSVKAMAPPSSRGSTFIVRPPRPEPAHWTVARRPPSHSRGAERFAPQLRAPRSCELVREILHHAGDRIGRRLAQAADRGIGHRLRELVQERSVPARAREQTHRLLGANPARRALSAGFVGE